MDCVQTPEHRSTLTRGERNTLPDRRARVARGVTVAMMSDEEDEDRDAELRHCLRGSGADLFHKQSLANSERSSDYEVTQHLMGL